MKLLGKILVTISLILVPASSVLAYSQYSNIGATVKISVCGNNIVEDMEDCEVSQNQIYNCQDFGFQSKEIRCDISCAYDLLSCIPIETKENKVNEIQKVEENVKLPLLLTIWDENNDGKLELEEFTTFIKEWVSNWKIFAVATTDKTQDEKLELAKDCDINTDGVCNIKDFSIILYHYTNE